jgi:hypothetical protein
MATSTFIGYPVDRMLAAFDDPADAAAAAAAVHASGIPDRDITVLRGSEGADRLDGTGAVHGPVAKVRRAVAFTVMDQLPDFTWYEQAVRRGGAVLMIRARGADRTRRIAATLRDHRAHFINHYGRFATEEIEPWRGPEPNVPDVMRR